MPVSLKKIHAYVWGLTDTVTSISRPLEKPWFKVLNKLKTPGENLLEKEPHRSQSVIPQTTY